MFVDESTLNRIIVNSSNLSVENFFVIDLSNLLIFFVTSIVDDSLKLKFLTKYVLKSIMNLNFSKRRKFVD